MKTDSDIELTLLSEEDIFGYNGAKKLEVLEKYSRFAATTDLAILTGVMFDKSEFNTVFDDESLKGRKCYYFTKSSSIDKVQVHPAKGFDISCNPHTREAAIRPVLNSPSIFSHLYPNRVKIKDGQGYKVKFGEYPQYAPKSTIQKKLENEYQKGNLQATTRYYTFDKTKWNDFEAPFCPINYTEYEYNGKKYIRVEANSNYEGKKFKLSNGEYYKDGDIVWVEVSPVVWLVDAETKTLVSKSGILSGIRFNGRTKYDGDFSMTEMKEYLDKYMLHDLTQSVIITHKRDMALGKIKKIENNHNQVKKTINPYGFEFENVSEEDIIRGSIESGVAVFLHGASSEGKSARVKQIDPKCEIIYLRNATPESLNGKSVYNQATGEMIDIKPSWLKKLEEKCTNEPDKLHIVFFDEITNALPSIQGIAFNIILDKEVNGIWKLPENARIVAAGNDMKDSLAANQLAEPLFNRFAHVYIKTTTESWLKWASEHNIHPAIYSYIAYTKGEVLRSKYDGEKPNADPRKWEMASKVLYATKNPEMLRALVGESITREFVQFCKQRVITLDDVLHDNYTDEEVESLNTAERYATVTGISQVDEANLEKVRRFVSMLGLEFEALFDSLWARGDESRLEKIAEERISYESLGGMSR